MKAGMDFKVNEDRKQTPSKSKGRRGMPIIDAKKGLAVSAEAAKALIAKGAADARPRQQLRALESSANMPVAVTNPSTGFIAGHQTTFHLSAGTQAASIAKVWRPVLLAKIAANDFQVQRDDDTISGPNSATSVPSSDTPDDPKDTTYGQRAQRKPTTKSSSGPPRKIASTAGKKRKSTEAAPPDQKRTRHDVEEAADDV